MRYLLILFMMLFALTCHSDIVEVHSMKEVSKHLEQIDPDTLVVFDIDMVVIQSNEPAFQLKNMKNHRTAIRKILAELTHEELMTALTLTGVKTECILVDEHILNILEKLRVDRIPTIALTAKITGSFFEIENMEIWNIDRLKEVGVDFSYVCPFHEMIVFDELPKFRGNPVVYRNGILFANSGFCVSKGDALVAFMKKTGCSPKKVIFLDDHLDFLQSVESALSKLDDPIEFHGIHFLGAMHYPSVVVSEEEVTLRWTEIVEQAKFN